jgi:hypothetical protein
MFSKFSRSLRKVTAQQVRTMAVSFDGYGQHVFRGAVAAPYLEKAGLPANTLDSNAWTTNGQADKVAAAVLEWAKDNGASVYCHWFQPLGSSAFRHGMSGQVQNTMLEFNSAGKPVWDFKGKNILKGETDGSSYPNGGLRATHTAGAYLSVDPTSPIFVRGDTIFIPASMVSYYGHALDEKTPLLRASDALSTQGARLLKTGVGYLSGNFPIYANPRAVDDPLLHAALTDFLLRIQRAYAFANKNFPVYAAAQVAETHLPLQDILDQFARRSDDFSLAGVTPDVPDTHQKVADTFLKLGVLDARADVGKFWDTSFNDAIAAGAARLARL